MDFTALYKRSPDPRIESVARYIEELSPGAALPLRRAFRPGRLRQVLGHIFLIEVLPSRGDYRFRLAGPQLGALYGMDLTQCRLSGLANPQLREALRQDYDEVVQSRSYRYLRGGYVWADREIRAERLLLPMSNDEGTVDTIFGVAVPDVPDDLLLLCTGAGLPALRTDEMLSELA